MSQPVDSDLTVGVRKWFGGQVQGRGASCVFSL